MIKSLVTMSLAVLLAAYPIICVSAVTPAVVPDGTSKAAALTADQLDNLLAPIALYPDPLLAQMLPASTFVDQIDQAARYLRANNNKTTGIDGQSWDVSVKSIAHYPQAVFMMSEKLDWTTALGQAYVTQSVDLFNAVQRLRERARKAGFLATTPQQTVIVEKDVIKIVPAQATLIYVPTYDPQVVYVEPASSSSGVSTSTAVATAAVAFGVGLMIGAWLNNDCNWYSHSVYYHGWSGAGWVSVSRVHVSHYNSYYVNARYTTVRTNTAVVNRNVNYNNINHYGNVSRNVNYNNVNFNNANRNTVNPNNVNRGNANNQNLNRNLKATPTDYNNYRGKGGSATTQPARPTATNTAGQQRASAFGGSGTSQQARAQSTRGNASRRSSASTSRSRPSRSGGRRR